MQNNLTADEVRGALQRIIGSPEWVLSARMAQFLRFVVEQTLGGEGAALKETVVGVEVFRRPPGYDPKVDPVVRVEARRLRLKIQEYYSNSGTGDPIRIVLPKGTYQPQFGRAPEAVSEIPAVEADVTAASPRWPFLRMTTLLGSAAVVLLAGAWLAVGPKRQPTPPASTPRLLTGHQWHSRTPSFSPDGDRIVFSRELGSDRSNLFLQAVDGGEARALTDARNLDYEPAWSRDGRSIAFLRQLGGARFAVMVSPAEPGPAAERSVAEVAVRGPIDWSLDGRSILTSDRESSAAPAAIVAIDIADGRKRRVSSGSQGAVDEVMPRVSPDGRSLAFVRSVEAAIQDVYVSPVAGGAAKRLTREEHEVRGLAWHPDGSSVVASLEWRGEARSLWRVPVDGSAAQRITEAGIGPVSPAVSLRRHSLAYVTRVVDTNLWRARLTSEGAIDAAPLTFSMGLDTGPQISPDGKHVAWRTTASGANEVWITGLDGTDPRQRTRMNGPITGSAHWSPDGQWLVFDSRPEGNADIFLMPAGGGAPRALTHEKSNEVLPSYSPDGRWIYFSTDRSGTWEVWRMDSSGGQAARVAGRGAFAAAASPDGRWLYYTRQAGDTGIWRIPAGGGAEERLTDELAPNFWGQWAVSMRGLYYVVFAPGGRAIRRLDLTTRRVTDILPLQKLPVQFDSGMSVTADEKWIVWAQLDAAGSDVYVVNDFR